MRLRTVRALLSAVALWLVAWSVSAGATITPAGDMVIPKSEITAAAVFYPYRLGNLTLEVLALRAPDGTVRVAFNTCQVCYSSGRGYYTQQGALLVCNNCGSRFRASQVELVRGGCNPLGITRDMRTEDARSITIPKALFEQARPYFLKWRK